jgi:hypothetical protein
VPGRSSLRRRDVLALESLDHPLQVIELRVRVAPLARSEFERRLRREKLAPRGPGP